MKKSDFYYDLPKELIAQTPIEPRDHSRMMVLSRKTNSIEHKYFYDFVFTFLLLIPYIVIYQIKTKF